MAVQLKEERIKPFLRWAGGKSWFIDHLADLLDGHEFTNYYEPFLGGGSIFFSINVTGAVATLSDANKELIDTYIAVRDDVESVIKHFATYENTSDFYYKLRAKEPTDPAEKAARFIYLNHTSYNGLYRVNRQGKYNVPFGNRKSDTIDIEEIRKARNIRQEEFAKEMGVSRQTISSLENGRYNPSILLAYKIAKYFEMPIEEVFIFEEELV